MKVKEYLIDRIAKLEARIEALEATNGFLEKNNEIMNRALIELKEIAEIKTLRGGSKCLAFDWVFDYSEARTFLLEFMGMDKYTWEEGNEDSEELIARNDDN